MRTEFDVIVIGGGLAGLAAGATAASGGAGVVVLEAHQPGGRARTSERGGFTFNMGAHALYRSGPGAAVLRALGVDPTGSPPPLRRYRAQRAGRLHLLPTGAGSLLRTGAAGPRAKAQLAGLLARLPRMDASRLAGTSVATWLGDQDLRPDAEALVRALVRLSTYVADTGSFGADAAVSQLQAAGTGGVLYLDGGWAPLYGALADRCEVRAGTAVTAIEPAAGRVEVVTADGRLVGRQVVVAAGSPAAARALLPDDPGWGDLGEPATAACLDVGVRRVPSPGYVLGLDVPLYGTTQGPPAAGQAPAGGAAVGVVRYGARSAAEDRPELEAVLGPMGVAEGDVVTARFLARMVVTGTIPRAELGGLAGRPGVGATGTPGLWLAGDWVGPDDQLGGAALASGHAAATGALRALGAAPSSR